MPSTTKKPASPKPSLRVERWFCPSVPGDLDALHAEQLRLVGQAFDGQDLPAADRLFEDADAAMESEQHFFGVLEWRELVDDATGLRLELWLASSDAGTFFAAGTTDVFAEMVERFGVGIVADDGTWRPASPRDSNSVRGRGIPLMNALTDHAVIEPTDAGTRVCLQWHDITATSAAV